MYDEFEGTFVQDADLDTDETDLDEADLADEDEEVAEVPEEEEPGL